MSACDRCGGEKHRGRCKGSGNGKSKKAPVIVEADPAPEAATELVQIEPSMGARLRINGHLLEIEQDRAGEDGEVYTHIVTLYPHEARQVIEAVSTFVEKAA